jgi:WD40 repeat protein
LNNSLILSSSDDNLLKVWKKNGKHKQDLKGHNNGVLTMIELEDGRIVSSGSDKNLIIWK